MPRAGTGVVLFFRANPSRGGDAKPGVSRRPPSRRLTRNRRYSTPHGALSASRSARWGVAPAGTRPAARLTGHERSCLPCRRSALRRDRSGLHRGDARRRPPRGRRRRGRVRRRPPCATTAAAPSCSPRPPRALRAAEEEIVAVCQAETGLPEARVRSELERTWRQLEAFGALVEAGDYVDAIIDTADPDGRPIPRPDVRRMLVPIGPVAVFGASNFPLAFSTAGGDTASALAAGCPVVVKGHPSHPGTSAVVAREVERRGRADRACPRARSRCCSRAGSRSARRSSTSPRSPRSASPARSPAAARSTTAPPARPHRSRSTPRWAASTRSSSPRPRCARAPTRSPRAWPRRSARSAASCARSPAWCSSRRARRATRSSPTSRARLDAADPQVHAQRAPARRARRAGRGARRARRSPRPTAPRRPRRPRVPLPPRPPTAPPRPTSSASRRCSTSASARSCCCSATAPRTSCSTALDRVEGQLTGIAARRARGRAARPRRSSTCSPRAPGRLALRRLPDRRRRHPRHDARRPVPGHDRARARRRSA